MNPNKPTKHTPMTFEASYVFSDTINRIDNILTDIQKIKLINTKTQIPFIFTNKPIPIDFNFTLTNVLSLEHHKKVTWELTTQLMPIMIDYNFSITLNTLDNSTFLVFEIVIVNSEIISSEINAKVKSGCKAACVDVINSIDELLQENKEHIYEYESDIIKAPREKVWDYLTHFEKFLKDLCRVTKYEGDSSKVGNVVSFWIEGESGKKEIKILERSNNQNKKKWKYCFMPLGGPFKEQVIKTLFVKLSDNETFLSIVHQFSDFIGKEELMKLENKKKYIFSFIRNKLENNVEEKVL